MSESRTSEMCDRSPTPKICACFMTSGFPTQSAPALLSSGLPKSRIPEMPPKYVTLSRDRCYSSICYSCFWVFMFRDFAIPAATTPCPFELPVSEIPKYRTPKCRSSAPNWDQWLIASPDPMACVFLGFHGSRVPNSYPLHSR
jgi:hypothetical protein